MISANTARDYVRNSRIPYYVIPQPLWGIFIGNSRALLIASEAKQSLGILEFALGILDLRCPLNFAVAAVKRLGIGNSRIPRLLPLLCSLAMTRILANSKLAPVASHRRAKIKSAFLTSAPYLPYLPLCAYHERFLQHFCQR